MRIILLALLVSILFTACNCANCQGVKVGTTWVDVGKPVTDETTYKVVKTDGENGWVFVSVRKIIE